MSIVDAELQPLTFIFGDDGLVPNNALPLLVYKRALGLDDVSPEATIEALFGSNGWGAMWRNGVYDYVHYHATVHEVLGVARGNAVCGSVATAAPMSRSQPATSPSCPPAPGINACPPALISRWSAPIRRAHGSRSRAPHPRTTPGRSRQFRS